MVQTPRPDPAILFSPITLSSTRFRNRWVMPAMQRGMCENGAPKPELAAYYARRAQGGVALIVGESAAVDHPSATVQPTSAHLNAATRDGWARCVDQVRGAGGEMMLQLWHEGAMRQHIGKELISHGIDNANYGLHSTAGVGEKSHPYAVAQLAALGLPIHPLATHCADLDAVKSIERADICLLVVDCAEGVKAQDRKIAKIILDTRKPCILVLNKYDLFHPDAKPKDRVEAVRGAEPNFET